MERWTGNQRPIRVDSVHERERHRGRGWWQPGRTDVAAVLKVKAAVAALLCVDRSILSVEQRGSSSFFFLLDIEMRSSGQNEQQTTKRTNEQEEASIASRRRSTPAAMLTRR